MNEDIKFIDWIDIMECLLSKIENEYVCSVIQKLNWNIDDFNKMMNNIELKKDVIYFMVLCDWITEACNCIYKTYDKYAKGFVYLNESKRSDCNKNFKAIRSFMVAHPLNTDRHKNQGYDGTKKCIDISLNLSRFDKAFHNYDRDDADFYLIYYADGVTYNNEGHDYSEIYSCVYYNVERIIEFGKYLSNIRKKDLCKY